MAWHMLQYLPAAVQAAERSAPAGFTVVDRLVVAAVRGGRVPGHDAMQLAAGALDRIEGAREQPDGRRSLSVEGDVASDELRAAIDRSRTTTPRKGAVATGESSSCPAPEPDGRCAVVGVPSRWREYR
ncbi:MAG TPA: hypothetical protein PKA24_07655 [Microthrixaceae bacterium]|nr:hypothetical protein [Microthrixaceae bacterium]